jgi:rubrerythrin
MYEELVNRLREESEIERWLQPHSANETPKLLDDAADAIEELSNKRVGTWHRVKVTQRSYSFVCNSCGSMFPYLTRCCPNCGVEYIDEEPPKEE